MTNRPLVITGAVLASIGAVLLVALLVGGAGPSPNLDLPPLGQPVESERPSVVWSIVAGLCLAVGAACVGIGMNRWARSARS